MTDVPGPTKWDVFISYAHANNEDPPGWVDDLKNTLEKKITSRWGPRAKVWKDQRIKDNDVLEPTILSTVKNSQLIVSVISPSYINSNWCRQELQAFCEAAEQSVGLSIEGMSRIFKVNMFALPKDELAKLGTRPELLETMGSAFYVMNGDKDVPMNPSQDAFTSKVDDVALAMSKILRLIAGDRSGLPSTGISVFLPPTSADVQPAAESLCNMLRLAGHTVLEIVPLYTPDFKSRLREKLKQANLSIHLIGNVLQILDDSPTGELVEEAAYGCANEEAAKGRSDFVRLAWRPPSAGIPALPAKAAFVEQLPRDVGPGRENLVTPLEELKTVVTTRIDKVLADKALAAQALADKTRAPEPVTPPAVVVAPRPPARKWVYIARNREVGDAQAKLDAAAIQQIEDFLFDHDFEVKRVPDNASAAEADQYHDLMMKRCEGVVLYSGTGDRAWLDMRVAELGGGNRGYEGCVVLTTPRGYRSHDLSVVAMADPFSTDVLADYVTSLRTPAGATP